MKTENLIVTNGEEVLAMADINAERKRQVEVEDYDSVHDDGHYDGSLWRAALFYVNTALKSPVWAYANFKQWPWSPEWFKPWKKKPDAAEVYHTEIDQERCLIKAGALIIAEQERLERALQKVVGKLAEIRSSNDAPR